MKYLIVDDEPLARERLRRMLVARADCSAVSEAGNGLEALARNAADAADVVLMDIRMPGMDGLEAAQHLMQAAQPPAIIFCTAYEEYAIAAFERHAVGYLLKPVEARKLDAALAAARRATRVQLGALAGTQAQARQYLSSQGPGGMRLLAVADVRTLLADQKYVTAWHPGGTLLLDESLRELELEFGDRFLRVHRNALVALAHVRALERLPTGDFGVRLDGVTIEPQVSRRLLATVRERLARL